ncbi:MAG: ComEC/Rec2 family competence protein, partial [Candidatus Kapaibacterium sp.]
MDKLDWKYYPALKSALLFSIGIVVQHIFVCKSSWTLMFLCFTICIYLFIRNNRFSFILVFLITITNGVLISSSINKIKFEDIFFGKSFNEIVTFGKIVNKPVIKNGVINLKLQCDSFAYRNSFVKCSNFILINIFDTSFHKSQVLNEEDYLSIRGKLVFPSKVINPFQPDFTHYYKVNSIIATLNCNRCEDYFIVKTDAMNVTYKFFKYFKTIVEDFCENNVRGEEGEILKGFLIGDKNNIDPDTISAFKNTGTSHLLAVSGQQTTLIAIILFALLSWVPNKHLKFYIILMFLLIYISITGYQISIIRASIMIITFMLSRLLSRVTEPLNLIGFSAIIILILDPVSLFDVGFQLSFMAVISIVTLYSTIEKRLNNKNNLYSTNYFIRNLSQLFLISFSVNLFIFPICIYHFGTFHFISFVTNLFAVPLCSIALYGGVAGIAFFKFSSFLGHCFGSFCYLTTNILLHFIKFFENLNLGDFGVYNLSIISFSILVLSIIYLLFSKFNRVLKTRLIFYFIVSIFILILENKLNLTSKVNSNSLILFVNKQKVFPTILLKDKILIFNNSISKTDSTFCLKLSSNLKQYFRKQIIVINLNSYNKIKNFTDFRVISNDIFIKKLPIVLCNS